MDLEVVPDDIKKQWQEANSYVNWHYQSGLDTAGSFRGPSGRAPFSDEGDFTFSEAPFEGILHEGLKKPSPSEGFKGA